MYASVCARRVRDPQNISKIASCQQLISRAVLPRAHGKCRGCSPEDRDYPGTTSGDSRTPDPPGSLKGIKLKKGAPGGPVFLRRLFTMAVERARAPASRRACVVNFCAWGGLTQIWAWMAIFLAGVFRGGPAPSSEHEREAEASSQCAVRRAC